MYLKIKADIKESMKNKETVKRDVLKMVVDKARTIMKEKYPIDTPENIPDEIMTQAIQREVKQLNQTKDALIGRETTEYYIETVHKITILSGYLPSQMTKEEVESAVERILSNSDYNNFGMKMKAVMSELRGKADNNLIKEVVEQYK